MPYFQINSIDEIYYQLIPGSKEKLYLVFLHEGLGCVSMWKDFPELLCKMTGLPGLVYDRLGYGKSSPVRDKRTPEYMHDYALEELPALLNRVIPDVHYLLVGHSDGGSISLILGSKQPSGLMGIITEAAHVFVEPVTIEGIKKADLAWEQGKLNGLKKFHGDKTETMFKAWAETWISEQFQNWNIENLLQGIEVPILAIQGEDDQYGTIEQVNSIVNNSSGISHAEMIPNCGHAPHLEAKDAMLKLMAEFIHSFE